MYVLYKVEMHVHSLAMRVTSAIVSIVSLAGVTFFFLSQQITTRLTFGKGLLILLSVAFMLSMPGFWISSTRFNVDNTFPLLFTFQALIAFGIWKRQARSGILVAGAILFAVFSPIYAAVLGLVLLVLAQRNHGLDARMCRLAAITIGAAIIFYLPSPLISKAPGSTSSNSGWLMRAGMDGDTMYFTNIVKSVLAPYYPRR